jgi:cell migration-inducing and hyaluronan-binding protein
MTMSSGAFGSEEFTSLLVDSLVVGETDNIGNPTTPEELAYGRSLPKREIPDFPIRGYEYYDYRVDVADTTFMNYQDNDQRETGALSWLLYTSSGVTTENTAKGLTFVNAKPVHFPKYDIRFDNDNRGGSAWRSLAIHDLDGSVSGIPDSYILLHDGEYNTVATDESCEIHPTWNASVCTGDVGRLYMRPAGGGGGFGGGFGAPRPPEEPIALVRNGKDHTITGNQSTVRSGTEIQVLTERPEFSLSVSEMDKGSWILFELPGFSNANDASEQSSMDALRMASETSYFKGENSLWVKLVVPADPELPIRPTVMQESIVVSR